MLPAAMAPRRTPLVALVAAAAMLLAALRLAQTYTRRLSDHRGAHLVAVPDRVASPPAPPRRAVVVVADGLGLEFARGMRSVARLRAAGQCRVTDVGPLSVSRPVFATLSTGLEQDRTGARSNAEPAPLAAESIWEVAREAGREVSAVSDLEWWRELFPRGFDRHLAVAEDVNAFAAAPLADLSLVHPVHVDHAGHRFGAASPEYAAAVARTDRELGALLDDLDLERDLVVFTADHGHAPAGGHGGRAPDIARVLTCFAGRGVARRGDAPDLHTHAIAGALAVLLGLRFPAHMRAGEDDLDEISTLVDPAAFSSDYLADRRAAVDRFRAANHAALAGWLGRPGAWSDLHAAGRRRQQRRAVLVALALAALFALAARLRRLSLRAALALAAWLLAVLTATVALHVLVRGSFDWTAINTRESYLRAGALIALAPALLGLVVRRAAPDLLADQLTLAVLVLALDLGHIVVFGWPLGFPLPPPPLLLFPFTGAILLAVHAALVALLALVRLRRHTRGLDTSAQ
jgi:hypothetical protein